MTHARISALARRTVRRGCARSSRVQARAVPATCADASRHADGAGTRTGRRAANHQGTADQGTQVVRAERPLPEAEQGLHLTIVSGSNASDSSTDSARNTRPHDRDRGGSTSHSASGTHFITSQPHRSRPGAAP